MKLLTKLKRTIRDQTCIACVLGPTNPCRECRPAPNGVQNFNPWRWKVKRSIRPRRVNSWVEEYGYISQIALSMPTINLGLRQGSACEFTLGGQSEPGSVIEIQTLVEYNDPEGQVEFRRTFIDEMAYGISISGDFSGTCYHIVDEQTQSIRTEVIVRDCEGTLSVASDSMSNLLVL